MSEYHITNELKSIREDILPAQEFMINIISATINHQQAILDIERACQKYPWKEELIKQELCNENSLNFAAISGNDVIGFILAQLIFDELSILDICVMPRAQGLGIGYALIKAALDSAKQRNAIKAFLEVRATNEHAIALYRKAGFTDVTVRKRYYSDDEDALVMTLNL